MCEAARRHVSVGRPVGIGWVACGASGQLEAIIASLAGLQPAPTALCYFGDLDPEGLRLLAAAAKSCNAAGLPPLRPADRLYELLLDVGTPQQKVQPTDWPQPGLNWLGEPLAARLAQRLASGQCFAQEWIGIEILSADPSWCTGAG